MKRKPLEYSSDNPNVRIRELVAYLITTYFIPEILDYLHWAKKHDKKLMARIGKEIANS